MIWVEDSIVVSQVNPVSRISNPAEVLKPTPDGSGPPEIPVSVDNVEVGLGGEEFRRPIRTSIVHNANPHYFATHLRLDTLNELLRECAAIVHRNENEQTHAGASERV